MSGIACTPVPAEFLVAGERHVWILWIHVEQMEGGEEKDQSGIESDSSLFKSLVVQLLTLRILKSLRTVRLLMMSTFTCRAVYLLTMYIALYQTHSWNNS